MTTLRCAACRHSYTPQPHPGRLNITHLSVCPFCHVLILDPRGRHQGEMLHPADDTADPTDWGGLGWA